MVATKTDVGKKLADIESDLRVLKWMVGTNFAGTLAILFKLFVH